MSVSVLALALHGRSRISRSVVPNESEGEESGVITHRSASNQSCRRFLPEQKCILVYDFLLWRSYLCAADSCVVSPNFSRFLRWLLCNNQGPSFFIRLQPEQGLTCLKRVPLKHFLIPGLRFDLRGQRSWLGLANCIQQCGRGWD